MEHALARPRGRGSHQALGEAGTDDDDVERCGKLLCSTSKKDERAESSKGHEALGNKGGLTSMCGPKLLSSSRGHTKSFMRSVRFVHVSLRRKTWSIWFRMVFTYRAARSAAL